MSNKIEDLLRLRMQRLASSTEVYELAKKGLTAGSNNGQLPTFISGLIGSSCLIEEIEQDLRPELTAKWGQIIDETSNKLSKEIDIIIFEKTPYFEWKKLGYALVPKDYVKAAIEVNTWYGSGVTAQGKYQDLAKNLSSFCNKFFLFCFYEECSLKTIQNHANKLKKFGFTDYFVLKRYNASRDDYDPLDSEWFRFVNTIRSL